MFPGTHAALTPDKPALAVRTPTSRLVQRRLREDYPTQEVTR